MMGLPEGPKSFKIGLVALDNFIHRKETIEHNTNQIKLNKN